MRILHSRPQSRKDAFLELFLFIFLSCISIQAHAGFTIELERDNLLIFLIELIGLFAAYKISLAFLPSLFMLCISMLALFESNAYLRRNQPASSTASSLKKVFSGLFATSFLATIASAPFAAGVYYLKNENRLANEAKHEEAKLLAPAPPVKTSDDSTWKIYSPYRQPWPKDEGLLAPEPKAAVGKASFSLAFKKADVHRPLLVKLCKATHGPCDALAYSYHLNSNAGLFRHLEPGYYELRTIELASGNVWRSSTHHIEIEATAGFRDPASGEQQLVISIDPATRSGLDIDLSEF